MVYSTFINDSSLTSSLKKSRFDFFWNILAALFSALFPLPSAVGNKERERQLFLSNLSGSEKRKQGNYSL